MERMTTVTIKKKRMNKLWSDFVREEIKSPEFAIQYLIAAYLDDDKKSIDIAFRDVISVYDNKE